MYPLLSNNKLLKYNENENIIQSSVNISIMLSFSFYLLFTITIFKSSECNDAFNTYKEKYNNLLDDYNTFYNTSIYQECSSRLDEYIDLHENELLVSDKCMENLKECENKQQNLTNSQNYTYQVNLIKNNIELEATLISQKEKTKQCEHRLSISYSLVSNKAEEIGNLKQNLNNLTHDIHGLSMNLEQCQQDLQTNIKEQNKILENLNSCIEREELLQDQKNKYVFKLSNCRKNNKKLKEKVVE